MPHHHLMYILLGFVKSGPLRADPLSNAAIALSLQTETHRDGVVYLVHQRLIQSAHSLPQTGFINCSYLFQQYNAVTAQSATLSRKLNVSRKPCFSHLRGYGGSYNRRAMFIARIILNDKHGAHTPLLAADDGTEVGIIDISASDCAQNVSHSDDRLPYTFYVAAHYHCFTSE